MSLRQSITVKLFILCLPFTMQAQDRYWVFFNDKGTSMELYSPSDFLSEASLERRQKQGIQIVENDYPVDPYYKLALKDAGFDLYRESRWLNAVSVEIEHTSQLEGLKAFPFVKKFQKVKSYTSPEISSTDFTESYSFSESNYGPSEGQIAQLNGVAVHNEGFLGQGITIAVMDASFYRVNQLAMFDSLWANNQILNTWDYVLNQDIDYGIDSIGSHGTMVLSCMGGYMTDSLIGTAPKASYMLFRTEDTSSETLAEEDNWLAASENADALGADVLNTSLGYTNLTDDPDNTHTYADMDGNTTVITIAADIAASKGMLVVNSAGNSGSSAWYYMGAPADGDSVLAIGAVGLDSTLASFSSHGPTADGRMKPNVVAQGLFSVVCNLEGGIRTAHGTSFSSPILAGMAASVWSAMPDVASMDLFYLIEQSGHLYPNGNNDFGYGIPDFYSVLQHVNIEDVIENTSSVYPNPFVDYITLDLSGFEQGEPCEISLYDVLGNLILKHQEVASSSVRLTFNEEIPSAYYLLSCKQGAKQEQWKLVK